MSNKRISNHSVSAFVNNENTCKLSCVNLFMFAFCDLGYVVKGRVQCFSMQV